MLTYMWVVWVKKMFSFRMQFILSVLLYLFSFAKFSWIDLAPKLVGTTLPKKELKG